MTVAAYEIVRRDTLEDLSYMVNEYLKYHYVPLGTPVILPTGEWMQAVYRSPT